MDRRRCFANGVWGAAIAFFLLLFFRPDAGAAFFEKEYRVEALQGEEILCDPYVVQKDDWVLRLFRQRGEIAHEDFPRFLRLFEMLNPEVDDIDTIFPGQEVLIPLRILPPGSFEGQESGVVTVPVITISNFPEVVAAHSTRYRVRYGDWISRLIAERFGEVGSASYERGMELFKKLNPEIDNINFIRAGQVIRLPDPEIRETEAYSAHFSEGGEIVDLTGVPPVVAEPDRVLAASDATPDPEAAGKPSPAAPAKADAGDTAGHVSAASERPAATRLPFGKTVRGFSDPSVFVRAAVILDAQITNSGAYFFPRGDGSDFRLDLSETPLMFFKDGNTLLFTKQEWLSRENRQVLELYWPDIEIVFFEAGTRLGPLISTIIPLIDPNGYERHLALREDGLAVVVRGQYIYDAPGGFETVCLTILENQDMRVPDAIRNYLRGLGVTVRDWVEDGSRSGWAGDIAGAGNYGIPEVKRIPEGPPARLVEALAAELGYGYQTDVEVSFPYAGFRVETTTDMLFLDSGEEILIDYGDLGGDAVSSIEKTGARVVQLKPPAGPAEVLDWLSELIPLEFTPDPVFWTSERPRLYNPSVQIPGYLVSLPSPDEQPDAEIERLPALDGWEGGDWHRGSIRNGDLEEENGEDGTADGPRWLVSLVPLPEQVAAYLDESGVRLIELSGEAGGIRP